jgi:lipoprotein-releasing system ATP-binding protein
MSILHLENLTKTYISPNSKSDKLTVLSGVNLTVEKGQKVAIIGQSGSGKSTLLHSAGLLDTPTEGTVSLLGQNTASLQDRQKSNLRNKHMGFVYQAHHLMEEFTALENVMMPALIDGNNNKNHAYKLLADVGLMDRKDHLPSKLSGGEQQRVAIARALMNTPDILLADEPTGNLDPETAEQVFKLFDDLVNNHGMALLMVTHNENLANKCDVIMRLEGGILKST